MAFDYISGTSLLLYLEILLPIVVSNVNIPIHIHVDYESELSACIEPWTERCSVEYSSYHLYFTKTKETKDSVICKNVSEPLHVRCYEHGKDHWIDTYVLPIQEYCENVPSNDTIERCYQNSTGEVCWIFHVYDDSAANCNVSDTAPIIGTVTTFLPSLLSDDKFNSANTSELLQWLELMRTSMFGNVSCARITGTLTYKGKELLPTSCVTPIIPRPFVDLIYGMIGDNPTYVTASFSVLVALAAALLIAICVLCAICFCYCYCHRYKDRYEIQENTDVNHEAFITM